MHQRYFYLFIFLVSFHFATTFVLKEGDIELARWTEDDGKDVVEYIHADESEATQGEESVRPSELADVLAAEEEMAEEVTGEAVVEREEISDEELEQWIKEVEDLEQNVAEQPPAFEPNARTKTKPLSPPQEEVETPLSSMRTRADETVESIKAPSYVKKSSPPLTDKPVGLKTTEPVRSAEIKKTSWPQRTTSAPKTYRPFSSTARSLKTLPTEEDVKKKDTPWEEKLRKSTASTYQKKVAAVKKPVEKRAFKKEPVLNKAAPKVKKSDDQLKKLSSEKKIVPKAVSKTPVKPKGPVVLSKPSGKPMKWTENQTGHDVALALQKARREPALLYFYASYSPYSKRFERDILSKAVVVDYLDSFIKVKLDSQKAKAIHALYGVQGFPTVLLRFPSGETKPVYETSNPELFVSEIKKRIG